MASFKLLGIRVDAVQIPGVVSQIERWIGEGRNGRFISVTGMHGLMEAQHSAEFKKILNSSDLVVPDGMPLVWVSRWYGLGLKRRVYGPELMETFFRETGARYTHFLYGGAPGVAEDLAAVLHKKYNARVVGTYSPPFRPLTPNEEEDFSAVIARTAPEVLWIGLSTPKQERWMHEHRPNIQVPVMLGVGAAFDFHCGRVRQAPRWMREHGLEWFFRLITEPRRLWRRYLVLGSQFAWNVALQLSGLKEFH
jgi:N-acetylglucosaminyldiphosphoundecaprenol N-acetyl-beta-D-mannosaminyltransferase